MAMVSFDLLCLHNGRKYYFTFNLGRERERASDRSNGDSDDEIIREQNQINWFDFNIKLRICRAGHAFISIECTKQKNHQGIHKMKMVTEPNKTETEKRKIITNNIENESVHRFFSSSFCSRSALHRIWWWFRQSDEGVMEWESLLSKWKRNMNYGKSSKAKTQEMIQEKHRKEINIESEWNWKIDFVNTIHTFIQTHQTHTNTQTSTDKTEKCLLART